MKETKNRAKPKAKVEQKAMLKNKKLLIIGAIIGAVVLIGGITTAVVLICNNVEQEQVKETVALSDKLEFEINSEVKIFALVSEDNNVNVLNADEVVDTSSLGEHEVTICYEADGSEGSVVATVTIVDTKPPVIEYQKELSTTVGTEIDLLKDVKVSDNSKEEIKATVEGDYDFNTEGTYNLKYVAVDKSGNKAEKVFTLIVNKKPVATSSGSTTTKPSTTQSSTNIWYAPTADPAQQAACDKGSKEAEPYMGKIYTAIPPEAHRGIVWGSSRIYITQEKDGNATLYTMEIERISGKNLSYAYADQVERLVGPLQEMRYTKENPLVVYYPEFYSCAWLEQ